MEVAVLKLQKESRILFEFKLLCILLVVVSSPLIALPLKCPDVISWLGRDKQQTVQLSRKERALRKELVQIASKSRKSPTPSLSHEEVEDRVLKKINAKLLQENRLLSSFAEKEKTELADSVFEEVEQQAKKEALEIEASSRISLVEKVAGDKALDREKKLLLDILRQKAPPTVSVAKDVFTEGRQIIKDVKAEYKARLKAVKVGLEWGKKENQRRWHLEDGTLEHLLLQILDQSLALEGKSFRNLPVEERKRHIKDALKELAARLAVVEKKLEDGTAETGKPWNWQVLWLRSSLTEGILEKLHEELVKENRHFISLNRKEREAQAAPHVSAALARFQARPTLKVAGVGLGVPIVMGYAGSMAVPEVVRPVWYIITGILAGPFTFGVNYYFNGLLKPMFSLKKTKVVKEFPEGLLGIEMQKLAASKPQSSGAFAKQMHDIGANSTGVPDPFKDGRNISKDGEIPLRDSLNDAVRIEDRQDAEKTVAAAVLYHRIAFPEAKLNSLAVRSLRLKIKARFANPEAIKRIESHIKKQAAEAKEDPKAALEELKLLTKAE